MKLLVTGSRYFTDDRLMWRHLIPFFHHTDEQLTIIHGDAPGADRIAGVLAERIGCNVYRFPAEWAHFGKAAGHIRNVEMLDTMDPDAVLAFPMAGSMGTWDMVRAAEKRDIPVYVVDAKP